MRILKFSGDNYALGYQLGLESKNYFNHHICESLHYKKLLPYLESEWLKNTAAQIQHLLPSIYNELQGLADGCERDFWEVLLWNCRGDLSPTGPEGCSSIGVKFKQSALLAHNEDGDPDLRDGCFILNAELSNGTQFVSFVYPGSIPGHTMGMNNHGIAYTVNNIRLTEKQIGIPRMITARTLLEADSVENFIDLLEKHDRVGGFHYNVADRFNLTPISIEAPFQGVSALAADTITVHANHLIHDKFVNIDQIITKSSFCRQKQLQKLSLLNSKSLNEQVCINILKDTASELPIYRMSPDDPDQENTLATVIFTLQKEAIQMVVYDTIIGEKILLTV